MKRKTATREEVKPDFPSQLIGLGILFLLLIGHIIYFLNFNPNPGQIESFPPYCIEVKGEVLNPGIYFFFSAPCFGDILTVTDKSEGTKLLVDPALTPEAGSSLWVKKTARGTEIRLASIEARNKILLGIPLNVNTATVEDFSAIPGIGRGIGNGIVAFRNTYGNFSSLEELKKIKGIGEKRFKRIKKYLGVKSEA